MAVVFSVIAVMMLGMFFHLPTAPDPGEEVGVVSGRGFSDSSIHSPVVATTGDPIIVEIHEGREHFDWSVYVTPLVQAAGTNIPQPHPAIPPLY